MTDSHNPSPPRQAVVVGLFVTVAVGILAAGILIIGDIRDTFSKKIHTTAVFDEVGGLQVGDNIWYSGVKVGTVKGMAFQGESQVEVQMTIDEAAARYIHADALAKIGSDGLIGNRIVVIYGGEAGAPVLEDGGVLGTGETASSETIMATLQQNNTNLLAITQDIKGVTARLAAGEGTLGRLMNDDALYADVSEAAGSLKEASASARTATASLSTFAGSLNEPGTLPHDLISDREVYPDLKAAAAQIKHAGDRAAEISDHAIAAVDGAAAALVDKRAPVGALLHDEAVAGDLKVTLGNLSRSSVLLADDLEAAQHNFLLRGFFHRKERDEARAVKKAEKDAEKAEKEAEKAKKRALKAG